MQKRIHRFLKIIPSALVLLVFAFLAEDGIAQTEIFNVAGGGILPNGWTGINNVTDKSIDKDDYYLLEPASPEGDLLITSAYDLTPYTSPEFSVTIDSYGNGDHNALKIEISYDGGLSYTESHITPVTTDDTESHTFSLNSISSSVVIRLSVNATSGRGIRLTDLILTGTEITTTTLNFDQATYNQTEDGGTIDICVYIINENVAATTADIVLTSGSASAINNYTTQTITFPASSSAQRCVTITITDNATCDGNTDYTFEIQNVSGENGAAVGSQNTTTLTATDDEMYSGILAVQDFDNTNPSWAYTGDVSNGSGYGNTGNGGRIGGDGIQSFELNPITIAGATDMTLTIKTSSVGGIENDDALKIFVNLNETGFSAQPDITIEEENTTDGSYDKTWLYTATGLANTTAGTSVTYNGDGATGYANIEISIPDGTTSVAVRIESDNNNDSEYYYIDDIILSGNYCSTNCFEPTTQANFDADTPIFLTETGATFEWTNGDGSGRLMVLKEGSAVVSDPIDGTSYSASSAFGLGDDIGPNAFVVYNGVLETVALTNLTPGTEYFAEIFEYNCLPGNENYFTGGTPETNVFITPPENPASFIEDCVGNSSIDLSWTAPANGNSDGYLLVVREGTNPPVVVTSLDPSSQNFDTDYTSAPSYGGSSPVSKVLYRGTATTVSITNLSPGVDYTFELYAFTDASSGWKYSDGTTTSETIQIADITNLVSTPFATSIEFSWNVNQSCIDEIIIAASDAGSVTNTPSGSGYAVSSNSFTDAGNPTLSGGEKVVYSGTDLGATITDLTTDQQYCFKIFVRKGSTWSQGVELCETPRTATILVPSDLSIVAINTREPDQVCFLSYKSITANTSIDFTDNGYERENAGQWGDTEGVIRITRKTTAPAIPAGQVICISGEGSEPDDFTIYTCGVLDSDWVVASLNGNDNFNLNFDDQIWIMQNGSWVQNSGDHDDDYTGNVLYGWTAIGWKDDIGSQASPEWTTKGSRLYPNSFCLSTDLNTLANGYRVKYTGPTAAKNKIEWIEAFNNPANWNGYTDSAAYYDSTPDYQSTCNQISIEAMVDDPGLWNGNEDTDWYNCKNWQNLRLPDLSTDVTISDVSNDPIISGPGAASYDLLIKPSGSLTINNSNANLNIYGDLITKGNLTHTAGTIQFSGSLDQHITDSLSAISTLNLDTLIINKPSGNVITKEGLSISGSADFTAGILIPIPNAEITFQTGATTFGASNASFVDGVVVKHGNGEDFIFPIGDLKGDTISWYQPARMFGYSGNTTIRAQYFAETNPNAGAYYDGDSNSPTDFQEIGTCDYWAITKPNASDADIKLALKYTNTDSEYCNEVGAPETVRIFSLNTIPATPSWEQVASGNFGSEIVSSGEIGSAVTGGTYGDFVLGGPSENNLNVLPITLLHFTAQAHESKVITQWTTASELNNAYFTIERSVDASYFRPIGKVEGAGTSHDTHTYAFADHEPRSGISYYRLKQTDFDGSTTYSEVRSVTFNGSQDFSLDMAYRTNDALNLVYTAQAPYITVEIFDVLGQRVFISVETHGHSHVETHGHSHVETHGRASHPASHRASLIYPSLTRGVYVVRIFARGKSASRKFFW